MPQNRPYKYFDLMMAAFVTVMLCSNVIGVHKATYVELPFYGEYAFGAGVLFFPISYLFGDVLTEVYGYKRSRRVIWAGFAAICFAAFMAFTITTLPAASRMTQEQIDAVQLIFGQTPRIVLASLLAFWLGEFVNSYSLAKLKVATNGRWLWTRTITSTVLGELADCLIFFPVAFYGTWPTDLLISVMAGNYVIKVLWEAVATPFTYVIVNALKRAEHEDHFDRNTDFNPFSLEA